MYLVAGIIKLLNGRVKLFRRKTFGIGRRVRKRIEL
jgi:hypothetical protein